MFKDIQTKDFFAITKKPNGKRSGMVDHRLIQGWSEIAAFHLDRILGLYMKPPMVSRKFDNHFWFGHDNRYFLLQYFINPPTFLLSSFISFSFFSARSLRYRNSDTFEYPMVLIAWLDNVKGNTPDWETIGKVLVMQSNDINHNNTLQLKSTSDTILFDFLIDGIY